MEWGATAGEEPPFDPDYDAAEYPGFDPASGYPGFDPGDEPSDDDETVAPGESSEEQAVRILSEVLGAERI